MQLRKDVVAGATLVILGSLYTGYSASQLPVGSLRSMGPGLFPMGLGMLLVILGAAIALETMIGDMPMDSFPFRPAFAIFAGIAAFAALVGRIGLFPAEFLCVLFCALSTPRPSPWLIVSISAFLMAITWFVFNYLLDLMIPLVMWRF